MSEIRKWQGVVRFTTEFVDTVGAEKLKDFARAPGGLRPIEITLQRRLTDEEVAIRQWPDPVPDNIEFWLFEGTAHDQ